MKSASRSAGRLRQPGAPRRQADRASGDRRRRCTCETDHVDRRGGDAGALFILDDPIFNGLAISLIFGILVSTLLTLVVIPVLYYAAFAHGSRVNLARSSARNESTQPDADVT